MRTSGSGLESLFVCPHRLVTAVSQAAKRDKRRVRLGLRAISAILSDFHSSPSFRTFYTQPFPLVPSDLCFRLGSCRTVNGLSGNWWEPCGCIVGVPLIWPDAVNICHSIDSSYSTGFAAATQTRVRLSRMTV